MQESQKNNFLIQVPRRWSGVCTTWLNGPLKVVDERVFTFSILEMNPLAERFHSAMFICRSDRIRILYSEVNSKEE